MLQLITCVYVTLHTCGISAGGDIVESKRMYIMSLIDTKWPSGVPSSVQPPLAAGGGTCLCVPPTHGAAQPGDLDCLIGAEVISVRC